MVLTKGTSETSRTHWVVPLNKLVLITLEGKVRSLLQQQRASSLHEINEMSLQKVPDFLSVTADAAVLYIELEHPCYEFLSDQTWSYFALLYLNTSDYLCAGDKEPVHRVAKPPVSWHGHTKYGARS